MEADPASENTEVEPSEEQSPGTLYEAGATPLCDDTMNGGNLSLVSPVSWQCLLYGGVAARDGSMCSMRAVVVLLHRSSRKLLATMQFQGAS